MKPNILEFLCCNLEQLMLFKYLLPSEIGNLGLFTRNVGKLVLAFMNENDATLNPSRVLLWAKKDAVVNAFFTISNEEEFWAWDESNGKSLELRSLDPRNAALEARGIFYHVRKASCSPLWIKNILQSMRSSAHDERKILHTWKTMFRGANPTYVPFLQQHRPVLSQPGCGLPLHYINVKSFFVMRRYGQA